MILTVHYRIQVDDHLETRHMEWDAADPDDAVVKTAQSEGIDPDSLQVVYVNDDKGTMVA